MYYLRFNGVLSQFYNLMVFLNFKLIIFLNMSLVWDLANKKLWTSLGIDLIKKRGRLDYGWFMDGDVLISSGNI